jgi:hypothetical protein
MKHIPGTHFYRRVMNAAGHSIAILNSADLDKIHTGAMRILQEMGMEIQHEGLLRALADAGLPVDFQEQRVRFPTSYVEQYITGAPKVDWERNPVSVSGTAGIYHGRFHDPSSGELVEWTEDRLAWYFTLANQLSHVCGANMLGYRLACPAPLEPLYERLYCWKYGGQEGSSIYLDEICPYLYELYAIRADALRNRYRKCSAGQFTSYRR